jgi:hypothetical protein
MVTISLTMAHTRETRGLETLLTTKQVSSYFRLDSWMVQNRNKTDAQLQASLENTSNKTPEVETTSKGLESFQAMRYQELSKKSSAGPGLLFVQSNHGLRVAKCYTPMKKEQYALSMRLDW